MITADKNILLYALRYAVARDTNAPHDAIEAITNNQHLLDDYDLEAYIEEINIAEKLKGVIDDMCMFRTYLYQILEDRRKGKRRVLAI